MRAREDARHTSELWTRPCGIAVLIISHVGTFSCVSQDTEAGFLTDGSLTVRLRIRLLFLTVHVYTTADLASHRGFGVVAVRGRDQPFHYHRDGGGEEGEREGAYSSHTRTSTFVLVFNVQLTCPQYISPSYIVPCILLSFVDQYGRLRHAPPSPALKH